MEWIKEQVSHSPDGGGALLSGLAFGWPRTQPPPGSRTEEFKKTETKTKKGG